MPTAYITVPRAAAADLASELVEERLAACVNVVDCESIYRWEGAVHEDDEAILLAKTSEGAFNALVERAVELHPYEVPCVERFDEEIVLSAFADWRDAAVEG